MSIPGDSEDKNGGKFVPLYDYIVPIGVEIRKDAESSGGLNETKNIR